jgi:biopolymer transport protein ExbB
MIERTNEDMNIDGLFLNLVALGATWVLWLLVGLSVLALAVVLERAAFFCRTREDSGRLRSELDRGLSQRELPMTVPYLEASPSLEASIVRAGAKATCAEEAEELMASEAQLQRLRAERNLAFLGTLGNNAPFVGLFGTVVGIIGAFAELEASGGRLTTALMAEIGEALVATAVGILVALPAVAAYNAFQRMIQVRLGSGDALGRLVVAHLHVEARGSRRLSLVETARAVGAE